MDTAERLKQAIEALAGPEAVLAALSVELEDAQARYADFESQARSDDISARVSARAIEIAWRDEMAALREARQRAEQDLQPYVAARNQAKDDLAQASSLRQALEFNRAECPYLALGQKTGTYMTFRVDAGHLSMILLAGDDSHPEYDVAVDWLRRLIIRSGIDAENLTRRSWRDYWSDVGWRGDVSRMTEPVPNAREVMAADINAVFAPA